MIEIFNNGKHNKNIMITLNIILIIAGLLLLIILSSLPLYISVNLLGGEATILRVFLTNTIVAILIAMLIDKLGWGAIFLVVVTILAYKFIFKLSFVKAIFAWVLQYIVVGVLIFITIMTLSFLGIGLLL